MTVISSSRYKALPTPKGFALHGGEDRLPVRITLCDTHWLVVVEDGTPAPPPPRRFGLFEIYRLIDCATSWSMLPWRPRPSAAPEWRIRNWSQRQARRSLAYVIGQQRVRLMRQVDPDVRDVQKAIFAATFTASRLTLEEDFYQQADRFLISDLRRYRACAVAVRGIGDHLLEEYEAKEWHWDSEHATPIRSVSNKLRNWRSLYSDTPRSYWNLNQTLDALPGGLATELVTMLRRAHLDRPITDRVELTVFLCSLGAHRQIHRRVFQLARRAEIVRALSRLGESLGRNLSSRRCADLSLFTGYLNDFPEPHAGGILSLTDRAIRWHHDERQREADAIIAAEGDGRTVALPPVPLLDVPGLTFLATVGAIYREGAEMGHCIATYVPNALEGASFLFGFQQGGERASVEVGADGRVRQSVGPENSCNLAARKAARLLASWGRTFPPCAASSPVGATAGEVPF